MDVTYAGEQDDLGKMLDEGKIDALISADVPECIVNKSPRVGRLFEDFPAVERDYYQRTGIFPIMHTVVVTREFAAQHPDAVRAIYNGFCQAKQAAADLLLKGVTFNNMAVMVPWLTDLITRDRDLLGEDWWPYGIAANRKAIDVVLRYHHEQGLTKRLFTVEDIFFPGLLETCPMKIIALEEHFATPEVVAAWDALPSQEQDVGLSHSTEGETGWRLLDLGDNRLAAMDAAGIDVQVISLTTPGVQSLTPADAVRLQVQTNDRLAEATRRHPGRLRGLASLATPSPADGVRELERAVRVLGFDGAVLHGRTRERNLDHPDFWPIYEAAAALHAPIYIHPQSPRPSVREAYYDGLDATVSAAFSIAGIGWHYETGVQILRMVLAGVFDRFPGLQLVTGHWGEVVLFFLERIDLLARVAKLPRPVSAYFRDHVSVTPSGMFSQRYLRWAVEVLGVDRILFSTDYPFQMPKDGGATRFLEATDLSLADRDKVASGNWDRLCAGIVR